MEAIIVTVLSGLLFRCTVEEVGGIELPREQRWIFRSVEGRRYIGPRYAQPLSPVAVREMVDEWWQMKLALGYAGLDVKVLKARLLAEGN